MPKASRLFRKGGYNVCVVRVDCRTGEATITLFKHGWKKGRIFTVRNFGRPNEYIVQDEEWIEEGGT